MWEKLINTWDHIWKVFIFCFLLSNTLLLYRAINWQSSTYRRITYRNSLIAFKADILDIDGSESAYVATEQLKHLARYQAVLPNIPGELENIINGAKEFDVSSDTIRSLIGHVNIKVNTMGTVINLVREGKKDEAVKILSTSKADDEILDIKQDIESIRQQLSIRRM